MENRLENHIAIGRYLERAGTGRNAFEVADDDVDGGGDTEILDVFLRRRDMHAIEVHCAGGGDLLAVILDQHVEVVG